jgi:hypothetical protein
MGKHYVMKTYGGADVYIYVFSNLALVGGEWSASRHGRITPGERVPGTYWTEGWVGLRNSPEAMEKIKILPPSGLELRPLRSPACSESLY